MREPSFLFGVSKAEPPNIGHSSTIHPFYLTSGIKVAHTSGRPKARTHRIQTSGPQYSPNIATLQLFTPSI